MIDSLGGILTKGLLGNGPTSLILGYFNLGIFDITITPTPPTSGGGSAVISHWPSVRSQDEADDDKYLTIKIRLQQQEITRTYRISNKRASVFIKLNESVKVFVEKTEIIFDKFIVKPIKKVFKISIKDPSNK
jgi:hypothetical protein